MKCLNEKLIKESVNKVLVKFLLNEDSPMNSTNNLPPQNDDYDTVTLHHDPKVRNGAEWAKYGGNFPVERNGKIYYVSRSVAVSLYVYCKNKRGEWCVLANQRGNGAQNAKMLWNVSAGYLDYNESAYYAAKRETWEETGVNVPISKIKMVGMNSGKIETDDDIANRKLTPVKGRQDVSIRFTAVLDGITDNYPTTNKNSEPGEVADIQWIPLSKVRNYKWAFGQGDKVLQQAKNSLKNNSNKNHADNIKNLIAALKKEINGNKRAMKIFDQLLKGIYNS